MQQIESRVEDAEKYIYPQKDFSDFVVCFPINSFEIGNKKAIVDVGLKLALMQTFKSKIF